MKIFKYLFLCLLFLLISACATIKIQVAKNQQKIIKKDSALIAHTFYLIGDAGNSTLTKNAPALDYLKQHLKGASKKSTLLFLGDNVYETGIPKKESKDYIEIKADLKVGKIIDNIEV